MNTFLTPMPMLLMNELSSCIISTKVKQIGERLFDIMQKITYSTEIISLQKHNNFRHQSVHNNILFGLFCIQPEIKNLTKILNCFFYLNPKSMFMHVFLSAL